MLLGNPLARFNAVRDRIEDVIAEADRIHDVIFNDEVEAQWFEDQAFRELQEDRDDVIRPNRRQRLARLLDDDDDGVNDFNGDDVWILEREERNRRNFEQMNVPPEYPTAFIDKRKWIMDRLKLLRTASFESTFCLLIYLIIQFIFRTTLQFFLVLKLYYMS